MSRPYGSPKRCPIIKLGWKSALAGIKEGSLKLLKYQDGHSELLGCSDGSDRLSEAMFFLTKRSTQLLEAALKQ